MNHMPAAPSDTSRPVNHVFVDFENVPDIDVAVIGNKAVTFTLLLGSRQTKLDVSLVEKLLEHAASVELVRLTSPGKNALDFTLAYYVGRAVAADPTGYFHLISRDTGYDPLIEHLRSRNIRARRHADFSTLTFGAPAKASLPVPPPATAEKLKIHQKPKPQPPGLDELGNQVLEHWRKPSTTRPRTKDKLVSYLVTHLGNKASGMWALELVEHLSRTGHLVIEDKGVVKYFM